MSALRLGYRHIDTARYYRNEADVGEALKNSGVPREDVFLTTKLWLSDFGYSNSRKAIDQSLRALSTASVDLMLMHAPGDPDLREETWRALEDVHFEGKVTSIGVSNFGIGHLEKLLKSARVRPAVNQIELTPFLQRSKLVDDCKSQGIALEAYSPLGKGDKAILNNTSVAQIARKHGVSNAQVLIRWSLQHGFIPLPKSNNPERQKANLDVYSFDLDAADMQNLDSLDRNLVTAWDPTQDPV
ncbi:g1763 [Coccomyxa elongata]